MSLSGREALPEVWECLGRPLGYPGVVLKPSRMSGSGWDALSDVRECSEGLPECPGVDL